jgi:hypothetical protein
MSESGSIGVVERVSDACASLQFRLARIGDEVNDRESVEAVGRWITAWVGVAFDGEWVVAFQGQGNLSGMAMERGAVEMRLVFALDVCGEARPGRRVAMAIGLPFAGFGL